MNSPDSALDTQLRSDCHWAILKPSLRFSSDLQNRVPLTDAEINENSCIQSKICPNFSISEREYRLIPPLRVRKTGQAGLVKREANERFAASIDRSDLFHPKIPCELPTRLLLRSRAIRLSQPFWEQGPKPRAHSVTSLKRNRPLSRIRRT